MSANEIDTEVTEKILNEVIPVFVDDGSTSTKLARIIDGQVVTKTYSNRAEYGLGFADPYSYTYNVEGIDITFSESAKSLQTSNIQYQYSDHSVAAIHHALHLEGLSGRELEVIVTLPISEFYEAKGGKKNSQNIERKKENIMRLVKSDREEFGDIIIKNVHVYPEAIPAVRSQLIKDGKPIVANDDIVLVCDMGGTTLDLALFFGAAKQIIRAKSYNIGMFDCFPLVKQAINIPNARDIQILNLLETGVAAGGRYAIDRSMVTKQVMRKAADAIIDFISEDIESIVHTYLIGGGSELLSETLSQPQYNIKHIVVNNPTQALVESIANIELNKKG